MKSLKTTLIWISAFSISMGFLETSVVVYLRELYYPEGFNFPLRVLEPRIALTEFLREAATIIMLAGVGYFAGKSKVTRFAWFLYAFAIWDIFYYVFLKVLLDWPSSLFTWDILFLIPVPWVGPVLAPCLVSLSMIILALLIIRFEEKGLNAPLKLHEKASLLMGCMVIIFTFMWDYLEAMSGVNQSGKGYPFPELTNYVPQNYNWWLFAVGELIILLTIWLYRRDRLRGL